MVPFVGQNIKWVSSRGPLTGSVKKIFSGMNAAHQWIDWMIVQIDGETQSVRMPITDNYFAMMKIEEI